jgi:hypothetical protein
MKRYVLFGGSSHYPGGGIHDFMGFFDSVEEAVTHAEKARAAWRAYMNMETENSPRTGACDWWHVADTQGYLRIIKSNI